MMKWRSHDHHRQFLYWQGDSLTRKPGTIDFSFANSIEIPCPDWDSLIPTKLCISFDNYIVIALTSAKMGSNYMARSGEPQKVLFHRILMMGLKSWVKWIPASFNGTYTHKLTPRNTQWRLNIYLQIHLYIVIKITLSNIFSGLLSGGYSEIYWVWLNVKHHNNGLLPSLEALWWWTHFGITM